MLKIYKKSYYYIITTITGKTKPPTFQPGGEFATTRKYLKSPGGWDPGLYQMKEESPDVCNVEAYTNQIPLTINLILLPR